MVLYFREIQYKYICILLFCTGRPGVNPTLCALWEDRDTCDRSGPTSHRWQTLGVAPRLSDKHLSPLQELSFEDVWFLRNDIVIVSNAPISCISCMILLLGSVAFLKTHRTAWESIKKLCNVTLICVRVVCAVAVALFRGLMVMRQLIWLPTLLLTHTAPDCFLRTKSALEKQDVRLQALHAARVSALSLKLNSQVHILPEADGLVPTGCKAISLQQYIPLPIK